MVKTLPFNTGDSSSIPGQGTKDPTCIEQLGLHATREIQAVQLEKV